MWKKSTKNGHPNLLLLINDRSTLYLVEVSLHFPRGDWPLLKFTQFYLETSSVHLSTGSHCGEMSKQQGSLLWTEGEDGYVFVMAADTGMLQTSKRGDYLYWKNGSWLQKKTLIKNFRFNHNFSLDNEEGTED